MNWSHVIDGELTPKGFYFAGISAGLKNSNKKDLALIVAPEKSICSAMFTKSKVRASCIDICADRIKEKSGQIRAILINSGHANACVGELGRHDSLKLSKALSALLDFKDDEILICSTGVIGVPLPLSKILINLPSLVDKLESNNFKNASEAILTTDLRPKRIVIQTNIDGRKITIAGFAKGSGMIYPNMATMLAFLTCDVGIEKSIWDQMIADACQSSFNSISVDGETSTNDCFIGINSGSKIDYKFLATIREGVDYVCQYLAKSIARDGEGANCLLEISVIGAEKKSDALKIAKYVVNSSLVKTAIHGCDPNWGRIISAAGNSGVEFNANELDLSIGEFQILRKGSLRKFNKNKVVKYMKSKMNSEHLINDPLRITMNLNCGDAIGKAWGCDLSKRYVEINSEYTT